MLDSDFLRRDVFKTVGRNEFENVNFTKKHYAKKS